MTNGILILKSKSTSSSAMAKRPTTHARVGDFKGVGHFEAKF